MDTDEEPWSVARPDPKGFSMNPFDDPRIWITAAALVVLALCVAALAIGRTNRG